MKTPLVFIIYNRPDLTQKVFEVIKKIKPEKLFIIADGPKLSKKDDINLCQKTRSILNQIDWSCDLKKNYSETNLGCGKRISSGLDWVFSQTEKAIILEDDCLPSDSFFKFCEKMLSEYENEKKIFSISGFSPEINQNLLDHEYYFSKFFGMWGWATWKRAWQYYDFKINDWPEFKKSKILYKKIKNKNITKQWERDFDNIYKNNGKEGIVDTWDFQFSFTHLLHDSLCIKPSISLIKNIGIGRIDATHTITKNKLSRTQENNTNIETTRKREIIWDKNIDIFIFKKYYQKSELLFIIKKVIKKNNFMFNLSKKILRCVLQ